MQTLTGNIQSASKYLFQLSPLAYARYEEEEEDEEGDDKGGDEPDFGDGFEDGEE